MKLKFIRVENTIETKLIIDNNEQKFDYLLFINRLINGEQLENIEYPNDITEDEKKEVINMVEKINEVINENTESEE